MQKEIEYQEHGVVRDTISAMVMLFIGIGVIVLVVILVGVIGGKAYSTTKSDIDDILVGDANVLDGNALQGQEIATDVNAAILGTFSALSDAAGFLGIIILALVFFLVLLLLASGMQPFAGGGGGRAF